MSLFSIEFQELFARHLRRHSQFGINVVHLAALFGIWFGVYATVYWLIKLEWVPLALATAYFAVIAANVPARVAAATALFLAVFLGALFTLPEAPVWVYLALIPVFYKVQSWSHKVWNVERDMTEFNKKYTKGPILFVVLLFFEVPIALNYLVFDRHGEDAPSPASEPPG